MNKGVMVAMSGGVDSAVAALLLLNAGYDAAGMTMLLYPVSGDTSVQDAAAAAERLGMPHYVQDMTELFESKVILPFCREYQRGATPNPCVMCNKYVKFGAFADVARSFGYDCIATGHYARIEHDTGSGRWLLRKAVDVHKDQTYMLYNLTQKQLAAIKLPLGELTKAQAREAAADAGIVSASRPDSQDICFVPDGDYQKFIEHKTGEKSPCGSFVDRDGKVLGTHQGLIGYTAGQRRGLGVSSDRRLYVISKNMENNTIILGDEADLYTDRVRVRDVNLIAADGFTGSLKVQAKIRYSQNTADAVLHPVSETEAVLEFAVPQRAAVRGQSAVFYDGEYVVGGGVIAGTE